MIGLKKVIVLLVDSLMPDTLEACIRHKTVPALQFLMDRGRYWPNCVTVFPTMTASVDSSLVTGVYPNIHKVPGLIWYNPEEKTIINYINGWNCIRKIGIRNCAENVLYNLNEKHLSKQVTTLFEELDKMGLTSASINAMVHRSTKKHQVRLPFLLDLFTGFRFKEKISGPDIVTLGAMADKELRQHIPRHLRKAQYLYGINDKYAVSVVKYLIKSGNQPDFMLVYLPDNDHEVHKKNPAHAEEALIRVDAKIQDILSTFASWDEALDQCTVIVISDHGQTRIGKEKKFNIDLDILLKSFRVYQLGEKLENHDLVVCNNERMAYVYPLKEKIHDKVIDQLVADARFDLIAWKEEPGVRVKEGGSGREIYFEKAGIITDVYQCTWHITGEWSVLDLKNEGDILNYGDYPDALSRLFGALYSQDIPVVIITARPRYELKSRYYPTHLNGGSHGSLHKYDSLIPLIVTGTKHPVKEPPRLVDLKQFIIEQFTDKN
ncbi:alkaline phosphatase family protein [Paenibacillus larvae]|uniref:Alkaline phosphatase family protein n=1 Tax=Paenibacillus larvae TaxID=1464 RepID=A0AAP5N5F8_9BACL|nr:alkaline phosphatase family protein [Paenibacillus larvae]MCY7477379.1 alkaline phosphatase family protein [Paenibacillus larvae]MCY7491514.1 alkaline phosphatase family protein [Paenibacillus larvae]MCY9564850.1 alkaline phosphatase family protein [Paenibacillus larvae]MCY9566180.1 alkaline phosphatase family protein [Paenibacillus larvae]MCY9571087.1 alkaline phosphatase family protein [Paenibacillus larvae]